MRKTLFPIVAAVFFILSASPVFAFGKIVYADRPLNLRDGRSPKAEWVGSLYAGQKVRVAFEEDGWVAVYEPGATDPDAAGPAGYSNAKFLKPARGRYEPQPWGETAYSVTKLNIRSKPDSRSGKVGELQPMERVLIDFPEDEWIMVFSADATIRSKLNGIGYCSAKYLEPVPAGAAPVPARAATPAPAEPRSLSRAAQSEAAVFQRVALTNEVNVHQSRTTTSPLVRTLRPGDVVQLGLLGNGWYAVFKASDMIRSESSSLGYSLKTVMDANSRLADDVAAPVAVSPAPVAAPAAPRAKAAPAAKPAAPRTEPARPVVSVEDIKAEAVKSAAPAPARSETQQTMVIDRSAFHKTKRPDPTPDQTAHGYRFKFLEKSETREYGQVWITLKVFLSTTKVPDREALKDFAASLWKDHRRVTKNVLVEVYLPGMDQEDLAWGVAKFDYDGMTELFVRRATLFGTKFM
ncbi:SH3 domain-containing protein [Desulfovibrio sp. Fe33]|uniref:SH3 domain-containing protein n=1 Tax=Desulfovibrio sp. Fe33 TaxID=3020842 RepID=UPI00234D93E9|nr:SH3 domain-containing protein [Desulfovibrio sp. Fe33]